MRKPKTISELIDALGGTNEFGKIIGRLPSTVSEIKRSGSIRVVYWPKIIAAAANRGIRVTAKTLMQMHQEILPTASRASHNS